MVGGTVIGIARGSESTLVHVQETKSASQCSIRVVEKRIDNDQPVSIQIGDSIWWQSQQAMWTPKQVRHYDKPLGCGTTWDIALPRIGYSH